MRSRLTTLALGGSEANLKGSEMGGAIGGGGEALCKVHNSIAVYAAVVSFLTVLCTTESL